MSDKTIAWSLFHARLYGIHPRHADNRSPSNDRLYAYFKTRLAGQSWIESERVLPVRSASPKVRMARIQQQSLLYTKLSRGNSMTYPA